MTAKSFFIPKSLLGRMPQRRSLSTVVNAAAAIGGMTSLLLMVQISGVASMAYQVQRLEDQRTYWQETNYHVETEIAYLQSVSRIENEAVNKLKMVPAKKIIPVLLSKPVQRSAPSVEPSPATPAKQPKVQSQWQDILNTVQQVLGRQ